MNYYNLIKPFWFFRLLLNDISSQDKYILWNFKGILWNHVKNIKLVKENLIQNHHDCSFSNF